MDLTEETCAPESFLTERFVRKVYERFNSNGVFIVETLHSYYVISNLFFEKNYFSAPGIELEWHQNLCRSTKVSKKASMLGVTGNVTI